MTTRRMRVVKISTIYVFLRLKSSSLESSSRQSWKTSEEPLPNTHCFLSWMAFALNSLRATLICRRNEPITAWQTWIRRVRLLSLGSKNPMCKIWESWKKAEIQKESLFGKIQTSMQPHSGHCIALCPSFSYSSNEIFASSPSVGHPGPFSPS